MPPLYTYHILILFAKIPLCRVYDKEFGLRYRLSQYCPIFIPFAKIHR